MQIKRIACILLVSLTSTVVSACDGLRMYSQYDDLKALREDGAFDRGWFPDWIPESAVDIHEFHDLDTNQQAISFRLKDDAEVEWPMHCTPTENSIKPRLKTKLFPQVVHKLDEVQNCRDYFAVQDANRIVHMWTPY